MMGPEGEGGGEMYAWDKSSQSRLYFSSSMQLEDEGTSVCFSGIDGEWMRGAKKDKLNAVGSDIERRRVPRCCSGDWEWLWGT